MTNIPKIIIKYTCPTFTVGDIVGALSEQETIDRAVKHLREDRLYDWPETSRIIQELNSCSPGIGTSDNVDLIRLISCVAPLYEVFEDAVYTAAFSPWGKRQPNEEQSMLINHYARNSTELEYEVKNRVLQYLLGVWAARSHIQFARQLKHLDNIVIMLFGNKCFQIRLYVNVSDDMAEMESNLKKSMGLTLQTANSDDFLSWAFPVIPEKFFGWDPDEWDRDHPGLGID